MRFFLHVTVAGALASGVLAAPAAAQLNGLPVYFSPKGGTGVTIYGDIGRGLNEESGKTTSVAARASLGVSMFTLTVGLGTVNPEIIPGDREVKAQFMGSVGVRLLGGGPLPVAVSAQVGIGYLSLSDTVSERNIPVGLGVALSLPTPGFRFEPWVAPRISIRQVETAGERQTQTGFGISAGVYLGFAIGLGIHAAIDWTQLDEQSVSGVITALETKPAILGVGLSYNFRLPLGP